MDLHIGQIIRKILKEKGITLRKFSDHMGMTDRNVQHFLNRNDIPISQIIRASEFLNEDLTKYFMPKNLENSLAEPVVEYQLNKLITVNIEIAGEMNAMKHFHELLEDINISAVKHGFKIS